MKSAFFERSDPYWPVARWIFEEGFGTGATRQLAAVVLSLYNGRNYRVDLASVFAVLDPERRKLAFDMMTDYARFGETPDLQTLGRHLEQGG